MSLAIRCTRPFARIRGFRICYGGRRRRRRLNEPERWLEGEARLANGPLTPEDSGRYVIRLTDAVALAHERGVVHNDLRSANVIVTAEGRA